MAIYLVDRDRSRFAVQVRAGGILSWLRRRHCIAARDFTGKLDLDPEHLAAGSLELVVQAASLEVEDRLPQRDRRRLERQMREEVLEVAQHPEIIFRSTSIRAAEDGTRDHLLIGGNLTVHGVTRPAQIDTRAQLSPRQARLSGEFSLLQSDFGVKRVTALGGALQVKDELEFTFDLIGMAA